MPLSISKPTVGGSTGTWGTELNTALDAMVTAINAAVTASTVTSKGDLLVATGSGALSRVGVGSNGYALLADSTTASGVAWSLAPGSIIFRTVQTSAQSFPNNVETGLTWPASFTGQNYMRIGSMSSSTTYVPGISGWFELSGGVTFANNATGLRHCSWVTAGTNIDGGLANMMAITSGVATDVVARTISVQASAGQGFALYAYQNSGGSLLTTLGVHSSYMQVKWLGP